MVFIGHVRPVLSSGTDGTLDRQDRHVRADRKGAVVVTGDFTSLSSLEDLKSVFPMVQTQLDFE
jgi:hypothetical protein